MARGEGEELLTGQDSEKVWGEQVGRSGPRTGTKVPLEPAPREISVQRTKSDFEWMVVSDYPESSGLR